MTHQEVMTMLAEMNLPYAYDHFVEGESPDPPFLCSYIREVITLQKLML